MFLKLDMYYNIHAISREEGEEVCDEVLNMVGVLCCEGNWLMVAMMQLVDVA